MIEKEIVISDKKRLKTKKGKDYFRLIVSDQEGYNIFDPTKDSITAIGNTVKLTGEWEGNYFNTKELTLIAEATPDQVKAITTERTTDKTNERSSIEGQVAAKVVAELWENGKYNDKDDEVMLLRGWLCNKLEIPIEVNATTKTPVKVPEPIILPAEKKLIENTPEGDAGDNPLLQAAIEMGFKEGTLKSEHEEGEAFASLGDFLMYCFKRKGLTKTQIYKGFELKMNEPLGDLQEAWAVIDAKYPDKSPVKA